MNFDVGLAINYLGARSTGLVAEALETAPFAKQLYSSDAFGPPELHVLGSVLWRRAMGLVLGGWVRAGDCTEQDAIRIVDMIGVHNAERVYVSSDAARARLMHEAAPLFESLRRFVERDQAPFYSPGHKGGRTLDPWFRDHIAAVDLNNLPDTDTLHCPEGPILEAERLIADAWGVGQSFILVQGSTSGNIAVALSALRPDEPVLVARNAHKSVLAGLVQVGARPVWLEPRWDARFGVAHGLDADVVERAFAESRARPCGCCTRPITAPPATSRPSLSCVAVTSATLLVDGAHSPHFAFHPDLPTPGEKAGAAATVQSVHKILSGLSQAAVLHVDPAVLDPASVRRALQLIQTTSPHFAIMASIDLARRQMMLERPTASRGDARRARRAATGWTAIPGLQVLRPDHLAGQAPGCISSTRRNC